MRLFGFQLIDELERFSEQDENVRRVLNRREKVENLRVSQTSQLQKSTVINQKISTSPLKKSAQVSGSGAKLSGSSARSPYK